MRKRLFFLRMRIEGRIYKGYWGKFRGLMFSRKRKIAFDMGKEIKTPLHTFFVFFTIHVYFLNENKKLVEKKENFKPFSLYFPERKARYIVESPYKLDIVKDISSE